MRVVNRAGQRVDVKYDKIKSRLLALCEGDAEMEGLDLDQIVIRTIQGMYDGITTAELDDMSARICCSLQSADPAYDVLAGRILTSNIHKTADKTLATPDGARTRFSAKTQYIYSQSPNLLNDAYVAFVHAHADALDAAIDYTRDYTYNYFSVRTMQRGYLLRVNDVCVESPQDMWMRVSVAVNLADARSGVEEKLDRIRECYGAMADGLFTHATPTLFNAGSRFEQLSSCFLLGTEDSLDGIYRTLSDCAQISKWAGGIGLHVSDVRAKGSRIRSTNGCSDGLVPMLKVFNETARYCNQSGRRKGSIAVYLEPWHADVWEFVELRRNTGAETERARDLFLALWVPDLFMHCVLNDLDWFLMTPDESPGLQDVYGVAFTELYQRYVAEGRFMRKVRAKALWHHIIQCQIETGTPYVLYKDNVNEKCNQTNLGTIKSSNLCAEITEYSDSGTYAVCNLASIAVNRFVRGAWAPLSDAQSALGKGRPGRWYDFEGLHAVARLVTYNLNQIIDANFYPTPQTAKSNSEARPIGIGVQGFADLYSALGLAYEEPEAMRLDADVMETIYHGALEASVELARRDGAYPRFAGSPFSQGRLQIDMWQDQYPHKPKHAKPLPLSGRWDWERLRADVVRCGTRNSMLTALMPTATTSQILGNSECVEPPHSNMFKRTTLAGEFMVVNKALIKDLVDAGTWNPEAMQMLVREDGSVQNMDGLSERAKKVYKTVWEIQQKAIVDHALARGPFVDQSQSMNLFFAVPNSQKLNSALIYAWSRGLKTGVYYLRGKPATEALKFGSGAATSNAKASSTFHSRKGGGATAATAAKQSAAAQQAAHAHAHASAPAPSPTASMCSFDANSGCEMCSA